MVKQTTREELVQLGSDMLAEHGYSSTGINSVLAKAGVPKGSFYYHFESKQTFAIAVIDHFADEYLQQLNLILRDKAVQPLQRIRNYFNGSLKTMKKQSCDRGCLIGNLSLELGGHDEVIRKRLDEVFCEWEKEFALCLQESKDAGELANDATPKELAQFLLLGWEGAILRSKTTKSIKPMKLFEKVFFEHIVQQP